MQDKSGNDLCILPPSNLRLPREKPLPEKPELTTWQKFALSKQIKPKSRKPSIVFDNDKNDWVKRWGYKSASEIKVDDIRDSNKIVEDHNEAYREAQKSKRDKVTKNKMQNLKNLAAQSKISTKEGRKSSKNLDPHKNPTRKMLRQEISQAKEATASLGKFQPSLSKEKPKKNAKNQKNVIILKKNSGNNFFVSKQPF